MMLIVKVYKPYIVRAFNFRYTLKLNAYELPQLIDKNGDIEQSMLEPFMPWSKTLPADCYSKRRK